MVFTWARAASSRRHPGRSDSRSRTGASSSGVGKFDEGKDEDGKGNGGEATAFSYTHPPRRRRRGVKVTFERSLMQLSLERLGWEMGPLFYAGISELGGSTIHYLGCMGLMTRGTRRYLFDGERVHVWTSQIREWCSSSLHAHWILQRQQLEAGEG